MMTFSDLDTDAGPMVIFAGLLLVIFWFLAFGKGYGMGKEKALYDNHQCQITIGQKEEKDSD